jgi:hypothetical protein
MPSRTQQLQIKHIGYHDDGQNKPQFVVLRGSDLKSSAPVTLTGPDQTVVPGRPNSNLQQDLRWYLGLPSSLNLYLSLCNELRLQIFLIENASIHKDDVVISQDIVRIYNCVNLSYS